jgi:hypothetical protein
VSEASLFMLHPTPNTDNFVVTLQFKGKTKGQSFYPGKGMRLHESFEQLVAASNPALETVRAPKSAQRRIITSHTFYH